MPKAEQKRRMALLRAQIRRNDVHHWLDSFLKEFDGRRSGRRDAF